MARLYVLVLCIIFIGFSITQASANGNLCRTQYIDLSRQSSGTLFIVIPNSYTDCTIELNPQWGHSVALSIVQYNVPAHHLLSVEDSDGYKISLLGQGLFMDNKKSIISERKMKIRYFGDKRQSSIPLPTKVSTVKPINNEKETSTQSHTSESKMPTTTIKNEAEEIISNELEVNDTMVVIMNGTNAKFGFFYFTYTQVRNGPCRESEFSCQNGKCLPQYYVCSGQNRCGDNSDNEKCGPIPTVVTRKIAPPSISTQTIILISTGVLIIAIIVSAYIISLVAKSKESRKTNDSTPPLQSVSSNEPSDPRVSSSDGPSSPSMCTRVQHFFQNRKEDTGEEHLPSERFEVPSMYPSLQPTAPEFSLTRGRENQGFSPNRE